jgi:DNA-binding NtrC family response regulator
LQGSSLPWEQVLLRLRSVKALVCWIGITDLGAAGIRSLKGNDDLGRGPIGQALEQREFDQVLLLANYPKHESAAYVRWAQGRTSAKVTLRQVELDDPTRFAEVYQLADAALSDVRAGAHRKGQELELTLHLSPGTPVMTAVWIILGKAKYPAELIQTSRERGLQTASIPLDIAAEFQDLIPELLKRSDASLEARSDGKLPVRPQFGDIVYGCKPMAELIERAQRIARRSVSVLIEGESGTGKELLARAIHEEGMRHGKPFVALNCGAVPKDLVESLLFGHVKGAFSGAVRPSQGYFREAHGGTLFLDEIGELPLDAQVKLLRVLQEKRVTPVGGSSEVAVGVRVIAATNRNLAAECQEGRFREDLFYRLAIAVLHLPPLRERQGDLGLLIERLLEKANEAALNEEPGYERKKISAGAKKLLLNHPWPGNVRELENTLMRATVWTHGGVVSERDMLGALMSEPTSRQSLLSRKPLAKGFDLDKTLDDISREYVQAALKEADGNKTRAAELLGLHSRQTLNNRMKSLGLSEDP